MTRFLDLELALVVAERVFGGPPAVRDMGLLDSALHRPQASMFGCEAYLTLPRKAAALMDSVVRNHALVDGNKRLALALTAVFLRMNGYRLDADHDALYDLMLAVADDHLEVDKIAETLEGWMVHLPTS